MIMMNLDIQKLISDISDISIQLSKLDVPCFSHAFKIFKAQSCLAQASGYLSRLIIDLSNDNVSNSY